MSAGPSQRCPHCEQSMRIRNSHAVHPLMRESYLQCTNERCGWTAKSRTEIITELSPSGSPNPDIVRMLNASKQAGIAAQQEAAAPR